MSYSHEWGLQQQFFSAPPPWGPLEGSKGQISFGPCREKTCLRGFRQSDTQTSLLSYRDKLEIEISPVASLNMPLSRKLITRALISLRGCADWSAPLLFRKPPKTGFSLDKAHLMTIAKQNFLAIMCVYEVSYESNSLLKRKAFCFFKRMFSVLNHLPAFGVVFLIAVSVFAGIRLCTVSC